MSDVNNLIAEPAKILQKVGRENRNVIYFTADIPIEIITAAGCVPYRIPSDLDARQNRNNVATVLQPFICSKSHQFFNFIADNGRNLAAGIFSENHCDSLQNFYDVIQMSKTLDPEFSHFRFLLPINRGGLTEAKYYFKELKRLVTWFENWLGQKVTYKKLLDSIQLHNSKRMLLSNISRQIQIQKSNKFTIAEFVKLKLLTDIIPVNESSEILNSLQDALTKDNSVNERPSLYPNILISGSMFDNYRLFEEIEILNKTSIATDLSFISRSSEFQVAIPENQEKQDIDELLMNMATAYVIDKIPDSVHHFPNKRRDHLIRLVDKLNIEGVIFIHYSFCDPDAFESRSLARYLETKRGIPTLTLVTDPQLTNLNQMTTRVEAFLEKIGDL
ncbi:MAG: 2-hydroxyacyl-CoA dehydratase subunit D [Candidatus Heimdallarchaeota archaeon]